jgi:hypothetical protein
MEVYQQAQISCMVHFLYSANTVPKNLILKLAVELVGSADAFYGLWPVPESRGRCWKRRRIAQLSAVGREVVGGSVQAGQRMMDRDGMAKCSVMSDIT